MSTISQCLYEQLINISLFEWLLAFLIAFVVFWFGVWYLNNHGGLQ